MSDPIETLRTALKELETKVRQAKETSTSFVQEAQKTKTLADQARGRINELETKLKELNQEIQKQKFQLEEKSAELDKRNQTIQSLEVKIRLKFPKR